VNPLGKSAFHTKRPFQVARGVLPPERASRLAVRGIAGEQRVPPLSNLTSVALNREGVGEARTINLRFHFGLQHIS
jgi:hypothetical protein